MPMEQKIKQIFLDSINSLKSKREESERELKTLENNVDFVINIPNTYMRDTSPIISKISSLYYKNTIIKKWKTYPEQYRTKIITEVVPLMVMDSKYLEIYKEIFVFILENEDKEKITPLFQYIENYLISEDDMSFKVSILLILTMIQRDRLKYNYIDTLNDIFSRSGNVLLDKWRKYYEARDFNMFELIMEIISTTHENFYVIPYFVQVDVFVYCRDYAMKILMDEPIKENLNARKHASAFIYKSTEKATKGFYKSQELSDLYKSNSNFLVEAYQTYKNLLKKNRDLENTMEYGLEYFSLLIADQERVQIIESDMISLVYDFILPLHVFSDADKEEFENYPENYIKMKYSYFCINIKNTANGLFSDILEKISNDDFNRIFDFLLSILQEYDNTKTLESAKKAYASLFLITNMARQIISLRKDMLSGFLVFVINNINSPYQFITSQCCYTLQFFDSKHVSPELNVNAFNTIMALINSGNEIFKVDAALTILFFLDCQQVRLIMDSQIPVIIQTLIYCGNKYDLESCNDGLETIMDSFPEKISQYAPELTATLSKMILENLNEEENYDKMSVVAGFIRTIDDMAINLDERRDVLWEVYSKSAEFIYNVFALKKMDYYTETISLVSNFLYGFKSVDNSFITFLEIILDMQVDEISSVSDDVSRLLDNYISFGKDTLTNKHYDKIFDLIEKLCVQEDDYLFEDDYTSGCKILQSIFLNNKEELNKRMEQVLTFIVSGYSRIDRDSISFIYGLEVLMCLLILQPMSIVSIFHSNNFLKNFIDDIYSNRNKFSRVFDKKLSILFCGEIFKLQTIPDISILPHLSKFFCKILLTLPEAINKRNKMKIEEKEDQEEEYDYDVLEEDIYFDTPLDLFEPFSYILGILNSNTPITLEIMNGMDNHNKEKIAKLLNGGYPIQKI
ncbi:Nonsense-mediated mRNA decay protein [Spraguea lophii 42_110]|uniref:Nonsense-mediated mRNA decay protein n=1 Tax=Spraguea lophii (strain 42_110) TaxID=1358809 RepID=S7WAL0_SPRLO|nr:Nonsense-mediated mRNA decay protein [Spraguea lophii 42_110]